MSRTTNSLCLSRAAIASVSTVLTVLLSTPVSGNTPGDPSGQLGRELIDQEIRLQEKNRKQRLPAITEETTTEELADDSPVFTLQGIRFSRSNLLTQEELEALVKPWLGEEVSYGDLQKILLQINQLYRSKKIFTAVAVFPEQRIEDGLVTIRLVEGSVGNLVFSEDIEDDEYYRHWISIESHQDSIDVEKLERDILFYNRVHQQQMVAELQAGKAFGLTDILVHPPAEQPGNLNLTLDNYGSESTGEYKLSALYQKQQLFRPGDTAFVYAVGSAGLQVIRSHYNAVVGSSGLRLGGSLQYSNSDIKNGDFSTLDVEGSTLNAALAGSWLAWSEEDYWITFLAGFDATRSKNTVSKEDLSDYQTYQYRLGTEANWLNDQWQLSGRFFYSVVDSKEKLLNANRQIGLFNPRATVIYNFESPFYALTTVEAQFTSENAIPGAVSFALGGPSTIRGYRPSIVSGDKGWYQQLELHYNGFAINKYQLDLFGFYDHGQVESLNPKQTLSSLGAGITVTDNNWVSFDLMAAKPLENAVPDQDDFRIYGRLTCMCWK